MKAREVSVKLALRCGVRWLQLRCECSGPAVPLVQEVEEKGEGQEGREVEEKAEPEKEDKNTTKLLSRKKISAIAKDKANKTKQTKTKLNNNSSTPINNPPPP